MTHEDALDPKAERPIERKGKPVADLNKLKGHYDDPSLAQPKPPNVGPK
jgi:hypothetical protein